MKLILIAGILVLVGCATYSNIDAKNWTKFGNSYGEWTVNYSLPAGYFQKEPHSNNDYQGLAEYHYDVLSGTGIYGNPWGETTVSLIVAYSEYKNVTDYVNARLSGDLSSCKLHTSHDWTKIACDIPKDQYETHFYVKGIEKSEFLIVIFRVRDKAYQRTNVRNNRIRMFQDILNTFSLKKA